LSFPFFEGARKALWFLFHVRIFVPRWIELLIGSFYLHGAVCISLFTAFDYELWLANFVDGICLRLVIFLFKNKLK
jgi:hypothetical protein